MKFLITCREVFRKNSRNIFPKLFCSVLFMKLQNSYMRKYFDKLRGSTLPRKSLTVNFVKISKELWKKF